MRAESLLEVALLALAQAVEVRKEGSWGPNCSPTSPNPCLEKSAPQASKRSLFLGRLEPGTFCKVQCSLAGRWSLAPWDKQAFVFIILSFWSMAGESLLVPISRCSCSHVSPTSFFCWVIGDQLPGLGDVCGIGGNVSRGFQLHALVQANRANTLGIDEEGTLQKIGLESNSDSPKKGRMGPG